jgi:release factor glutamine methyltransferase
MQLREYFHQFIRELKPLYGADEAQMISEMIFEHFAKTKRTAIVANPHRILENDILQSLAIALKRLKTEEPVQQVIGHCHFAGLDFFVNTDVLIPRPETEELVLKARDFLSAPGKKNMLDIGTGSGCIPITLQHSLQHIKATAIEISAAALEVARKNASANNTAIQFMQLNFLEENNWEKLGIYDLIISNPPYIPMAEKEKISRNVTGYEPHIALFVPDEDPLIFYKKIARFASTHLANDGAVLLETHESFAGDVAACFETQGWKHEIIKDLFGKERMLKATPIR